MVDVGASLVERHCVHDVPARGPELRQSPADGDLTCCAQPERARVGVEPEQAGDEGGDRRPPRQLGGSSPCRRPGPVRGEVPPRSRLVVARWIIALGGTWRGMIAGHRTERSPDAGKRSDGEQMPRGPLAPTLLAMDARGSSVSTGDATPGDTLESVELFRADLELRRPVGTAKGAHRRRPVAFVRVRTATAEGWGECAALESGTAVDAPLRVVLDALGRVGVPRLFAAVRARAGALPPAAQVAALFGTGVPTRAVAATLEMAVLDAELRGTGTALWRRLGADEEAARRGAPVGHLVGIPPDRSVDALVGAVGALVDRAARVRVKIEPGWDLEPLRALRAAFPGLLLQADANASYRLGGEGIDDARRLEALDGAGLGCIEQPLPPADLAALAALAARLETPVCLDETLRTLRRLRDALRYGACDVACIKPARFGGLLGARTAQQVCADVGVPAFVGGFFETGFARAANASLALLGGFSLPGDLSDPGEYLHADVAGAVRGGDGVVAPRYEGSMVRPYDGPGIAPAPQLAAPVLRWCPREVSSW